MSAKAEVTEARFNAFMRQAGPVKGAVDNPSITGTAGNNVAVAHYTVPAADAAALAGGEHFKGHLNGNFSTGAAAPTDVTFTVYWNGIGGAQLVQLAVPAAGRWANASAVAYDIDFDIHFVSNTEAESTIKLWWHTVGGVGGSVSWFAVTNNNGLTTGGARDITLAYNCNSTSSMTLTTKGARIWREA